MTGKIVNLRSARKSAGRDAKRKAGDENAARFGRSKAQRAAEDADAERARQHLDQHRIDESDD